ncbi:MAG: DUF3052 domain-containing protein [Pseudomonadota bacterium]
MTKPPTHGYSGKPLFQKLGLKPGMRCLPINAPDHYQELVAGADGVVYLDKPAEADLVQLFCLDRATLERDYKDAFDHCAEGGMVWISWPKKSSKLFKDLTEDMLREVLLPTGWVDVKVCAVDQDWSGLKFMRRKV